MVMECPETKRRRVHSHSPGTKSSTSTYPTPTTSTTTTTITTSTTATATTPICFSSLLSSTTSSSSRLADGIQQESNVVTKPCQTVVLYTVEQVAYIQLHLHLLRIERIKADLVQCTDKDHFMRIDFTKYSRIDLLVDETMCGLLVVNDELHMDVHRKFKEIDSSDKTIYVSNKMSTDDELFGHLYFRLPRKASVCLTLKKEEYWLPYTDSEQRRKWPKVATGPSQYQTLVFLLLMQIETWMLPPPHTVFPVE